MIFPAQNTIWRQQELCRVHNGFFYRQNDNIFQNFWTLHDLTAREWRSHKTKSFECSIFMPKTSFLNVSCHRKSNFKFSRTRHRKRCFQVHVFSINRNFILLSFCHWNFPESSIPKMSIWSLNKVCVQICRMKTQLSLLYFRVSFRGLKFQFGTNDQKYVWMNSHLELFFFQKINQK